MSLPSLLEIAGWKRLQTHPFRTSHDQTGQPSNAAAGLTFFRPGRRSAMYCPYQSPVSGSRHCATPCPRDVLRRLWRTLERALAVTGRCCPVWHVRSAPVISLFVISCVPSPCFAYDAWWLDRCWLLGDVAGTEPVLGGTMFPRPGGVCTPLSRSRSHKAVSCLLFRWALWRQAWSENIRLSRASSHVFSYVVRLISRAQMMIVQHAVTPRAGDTRSLLRSDSDVHALNATRMKIATCRWSELAHHGSPKGSGSACRLWYGVSLHQHFSARWLWISFELSSRKYAGNSTWNAANVFSPRCALSPLVERMLKYAVMTPWMVWISWYERSLRAIHVSRNQMCTTVITVTLRVLAVFQACKRTLVADRFPAFWNDDTDCRTRLTMSKHRPLERIPSRRLVDADCSITPTSWRKIDVRQIRWWIERRPSSTYPEKSSPISTAPARTRTVMPTEPAPCENQKISTVSSPVPSIPHVSLADESPGVSGKDCSS